MRGLRFDSRAQPTVRYLERAFLARRPSLLQRVALALTRLVRPGILTTRESLRQYMADRVRVMVRAYGDDDPDEYRRMGNGDWWMKQGLGLALGEAGFIVTECDPDVVIHLHGQEVSLPQRAAKVLWIHDNPDKLTSRFLAQYDRVFCLSERLADRVRSLGRQDATVLGLAAALRPRVVPHKYQVVFVGNARIGGIGEVSGLNGTRPVIEELGPPDFFDLKIWGRRFKSLPPSVWMGEFVDYHDLPEVYGGALISLNDHYPAMVQDGIISPRVYDILASGGFCISDANPGLTEVFGDAVPQYRSRDELRSLVRHFLEHPEARLPLMAKGQAIATASTWSDKARTLMASVRSCVEHPPR